MAAARAVWQRTVNRCFVQEDSKRAPKLTYYQSSSSTSSTKQDKDPVSSQDSIEPPQNQISCAGFMPLHRNPNFPDLLPHNNRFWSHHHHHVQVNKKPLEADVNKPEPFDSERFQEFIEMMETRESYGSIGYDEKGLNELPFDPISPLNPLSSEKAGPWWRTTDKDELASLVAQRSLDYVENCDLPTPQKMKHSYYSSHGQNSCKNRTDASSRSDLSKSKLLEAVRHSQARAREAENMATEANAEKEHLVKLLLKQASELFGYKQLLQMLQLETLYLKIKNKKSDEPPVSSIPWSNCKTRKPARKRRSKRGKPKAAKYLFGLALGLSLVTTGLILGWTVGWMQILSF